MSLNFSRQTFFAIFVPLLLVAGLFWLSEIRGYRAEMSVLVLPKTEFAKGAAENLAALSREIPFALSVYTSEPTLENPLTGKTVAERTKLWKEAATITTSGRSDLIRISVRGADQDEALGRIEAVAAELVRTASRYYNQKTDIDIRIIEEPATIPSFTAWPRFLVYTIGTALFFTVLFFLIYGLVNRLFPKRPSTYPGNGEYVISPDTFKPRVPTYWQRDEQVAEKEESPLAATETLEEGSVESADDITSASERDEDEPETDEYIEAVENAQFETGANEDSLPIEAGAETETISSQPVPIVSDEPEYHAEQSASVQYVEHAAAPDNLPVFDGPITPLQGAQARLMKLDIDAAASALSSEAMVEEIDHTPKTHEPTPDEYKRRLNDLLSGKM